ncbi:MAG: hypothetical protein ACI89G_003261, partial [Minisyncoccia bacterium]
NTANESPFVGIEPNASVDTAVAATDGLLKYEAPTTSAGSDVMAFAKVRASTLSIGAAAAWLPRENVASKEPSSDRTIVPLTTRPLRLIERANFLMSTLAVTVCPFS